MRKRVWQLALLFSMALRLGDPAHSLDESLCLHCCNTCSLLIGWELEPVPRPTVH
ncbi:hypothetical protein BRADI_4g36106v3 [Brachypodium distachyon]|uniref:Uncharacterized protein n=1 Tax=Brachypodium distachyon TaxID=15368 RepID=A0A2K2CSL9_BRADI|nr:hypothetical protein BRADI_4g36106v3 [Brachypodium distachyon]